MPYLPTVVGQGHDRRREAQLGFLMGAQVIFAYQAGGESAPTNAAQNKGG